MRVCKQHQSVIHFIFVSAFLIFTLISQVHAQGKVIGIISVDWEGRILDEKNLEAMEAFREDYPHIGLLHFLNAAYYTKTNANPYKVTRKIKQVLRNNDEHGLHIHAWRSLVEYANVTFRRSPNWSYPGPISLNSCYTSGDCGANVPISAYTTDELKDIISVSKQILINNGFKQPVSFRAGGWMAEPNVITALSAEGFLFDSSATAPALLKGRRWSNRLYNWLNGLWTTITPVSQPYLIGPAYSPLWEIPDNGILADYITGPEMLAVLKQNIEKWRKNPQQTIYVSIGFHQETADKYLHRIRDAVDLFENYTEEQQVPFEWIQLPLSSATF
ncbi:hypothetical protein [Zooshikella harenae]|uniref:Polysaccharide deacetylase n=1 Tax=Zooshikella harenae TaxID=2827238 RepID=A0ABS5Z9Y6_9GAMM|nr:hypothetical protein [Zooshikella harenae]MBU2710800.1 hypothetical protein [Zooshikella harenae]